MISISIGMPIIERVSLILHHHTLILTLARETIFITTAYYKDMPEVPTKLPSRKVPVALTLIVVSIIYAVWQNFSGQQSVVVTMPTVSSAPQIIPTQTNPLITTPVPIAQSPQPQKSSGAYVDGTYTGTPVNAYYGTVQVEAVVQNGALSNVVFLQSPSDRSNSKRISTMAMPILTQEALQVQSAQVNSVSGATDISNAFVQSLASALTQAKN
jgi:uncharacterized protein with FMN-binding domain